MRAIITNHSRMWCVVVGLVFLSPVTFGDVTLPFTESFEAYSVGDLPTGSGTWNKSGTDAEVLVVTNPVLIGEKACSFTDVYNDGMTNVVLDIDESASYTSVWFEVYAKPYRYDDGTNDPPVENVTGAFYVNTNGNLIAYDNESWETLVTGLPDDIWIGFKAYLNYNAGEWDLYYTTNGYGSSWTKANSSGVMGMCSASNELYQIGFHNSARIDAISIYAVSTGGGIGLPFFDGFEVAQGHTLSNSPNGINCWSVTGTGTAVVVGTPIREGSQACQTEQTDLTLNLDEAQGQYSNVWCGIYIQTDGYNDFGGTEPPDVDADAVIAYYISTAGVLRVYVESDGTNAWTNILTEVPLNTWIGLTAHLDYNTQQWDLYYSAGSYGDTMQKLNASPLPFCTNGTDSVMNGFVMQNQGKIDAVALSVGLSAVDADSGSNLMTQTCQGGGTNAFSISDYSYAQGENTLADKLGQDLAQALEHGDEIWIHYTNGWKIFRLELDTWVGKSGIAASNMTITSTMGMYLKRLNATNAVSFVMYDTTTNSPNPTLYGTNNAFKVGWNLLTWPKVAEHADVNGWGFDQKKSGDMIYIYRNNQLTVLNWNEYVNKWRENGAANNYEMQKDQVFWYYSTTNANTTWSVY
ncbi:MAG: hypothetical protein JXN60_08215 [Lentisphaerae bacterium]|nr:hypothetical protein [Lentisphaerota bacterium]